MLTFRSSSNCVNCLCLVFCTSRLFSLALLPIIIFESGYSLNLNAFFSQLGSVLMFALAGTVTATLICGLILFEFGKSGAVPALSFEECMAFASLVSATDPVATLSVFSALNVQPHLYAIVYGEAVLNDAVAIVLYRTFTKFLTVVRVLCLRLWGLVAPQLCSRRRLQVAFGCSRC